MKEPAKNAVANAASAVAEAVIPQMPDTEHEANMALLRANAELKAVRYTAQETQAQRDRANTEAAEFGARCRIAQEENQALHQALQAEEKRATDLAIELAAARQNNAMLSEELAALHANINAKAAMLAPLVPPGADSAELAAPTVQ